MSTERENIRQLLSAYIDGELNEADARKVKNFADADPSLRDEIEQLKKVRRWVSDVASDQPAPEGLAERLMERIERKHLLNESHTHAAFYHTRWFSMAAAAIVLIVVGAGIFVAFKMNDQLKKTTEHPASVDIAQKMKSRPKSESADTRYDDYIQLGGEISKTPVTQPDIHNGQKTYVAMRDDKEGWGEKDIDSQIWTNDIESTVNSVETSLKRYGISSASTKVVNGDGIGGIDAGSDQNVYFTQKLDSKQVQIVVYAADEVLAKLKTEMTGLEKGQIVAVASVPAPVARNARGGYFFRSRGLAKTAEKAAPIPTEEKTPTVSDNEFAWRRKAIKEELSKEKFKQESERIKKGLAITQPAEARESKNLSVARAEIPWSKEVAAPASKLQPTTQPEIPKQDKLGFAKKPTTAPSTQPATQPTSKPAERLKKFVINVNFITPVKAAAPASQPADKP